MTASVYLGLDLISRSSAFLRKQNEIGRSLNFNAQTNAHPRQPNPIHFDLVFSTPRDNKRMNPVHLPRQTLPREHFKLHPYTLCVSARLVC